MIQAQAVAFHALVLQVAVLGLQDLAGGEAGPDATSPTLGWEVEKQGAYVTSLCRDRAGEVWVGTEDKGIWRGTRTVDGGMEWRSYGTKDGLAEAQVYAIACDAAGRIWAGHASCGVSVLAGGAWHRYDIDTGPLGERIYDLAYDPRGDAVWMATNAGLTRHDCAAGTWTHITRADGLPGEAVQAVACGADGTVYAGMQAAGVVIGTSSGREWKWRVVDTGLASPRINDVVACEGTVAVASDRGLAISRDRGRTWSTMHAAPVAEVPAARPPAGAVRQPLRQLAEEHVVALACDGPRRLLIGHRQAGWEVLDLETGACTRGPTPPTSDFVTALLPGPGAGVISGWYGMGLHAVAAAAGSATSPRAVPAATGKPGIAPPTAPPAAPSSEAAVAPLPAPASDQRVAALTAAAESVPAVRGRQPAVIELADDWRTRGTWLGRRGTYWMCLAACRAPQDYIWGAGERAIDYVPFIGKRANQLDSLRYWVHWLYTDQERSLELPPTYLDGRVRRGMTTRGVARRQSEWDDHGEAYPLAYDGPHVYCSLAIPDGLFALSLYNVNKDGHEGLNRLRDYRISLRQTPQATLRAKPGDDPLPPDVTAFDTWPELANGRNCWFWAGVWKRYLVNGPLVLTIELDRNGSQNAILAGLALDREEPLPAPYFRAEGQPAPPIAKDTAVGRLLAALERARGRNPRWWAEHAREGYACALRLLDQQLVPDPALVATCCYHLQLYGRYESLVRALGLVPAREVESGITWDGVSLSNSGCGRQQVLRRLSGAHLNHLAVPPVAGRPIGERP